MGRWGRATEVVSVCKATIGAKALALREVPLRNKGIFHHLHLIKAILQAAHERLGGAWMNHCEVY